MQLRVETAMVPGLDRSVARVTLETDHRPTDIKHHIAIVDCSGSMSGSLNSVKTDLKRFIEGLGENCHASVIIFSGHNRARLICGPTQCSQHGITLINRAIDNEVRILDVTVFSEALERTLEAAKRLAGDDITQAAVLFTDGCAVPTQWTVFNEHERSFGVARQLRDRGVILHAIGYGVYYDKRFIEALMSAAGNSGIARHIDDIDDFSEAIADIKRVTEETVPLNCLISLTSPRGNVGRVFRPLPELTLVGNGQGSFFGLKDGVATLYIELDQYVSQLTVSGQVGTDNFQQTLEADSLPEEGLANFVRLLAGYSFLQGDGATAAELFEMVGEEGLAEVAANAFSDREQRRHGDTFRQMFRRTGFIGTGLKAKGPNHNVLNVLRILIGDPTNVLYLPPGSYKRSGLKTADSNVLNNPLGGVVKVVSFTSHEERLNFSITCLKDVKVKDEGGQIIDKQIWRTYNIVLDGNLHTPRLLARVSEESFRELQEAGVIAANQRYDATQAYLIDLSQIKLVSPNWARPGTLGLVDLLREIDALKAEQWALNQLFREEARAEDDPGIYRPEDKVVEGIPTETYKASCVKITLLKNKAQQTKEQYKVAWEARMNEDNFGNTGALRLKEVRHRLRVVRYNLRAIIFAMELTNSRAIAWSPATTNRHGKQEQEAVFNGANLKRTAWVEECVCS